MICCMDSFGTVPSAAYSIKYYHVDVNNPRCQFPVEETKNQKACTVPAETSDLRSVEIENLRQPKVWEDLHIT